ncbi:hypothetical protein Sjap_019832 [Stephania japonica]|uniref:Uncharacterized protein n=1 Tax=Stephania japonica TaxID=461633 RepID=A0AAP0F6W5_9MAGN
MWLKDGQTNAVNASLGNRKDAQLDQLMETYPNATDGSEGLHQPTPLAEKIKALHLMNENQRIASQSSSLHIPTRLSSNEESLARQLGSRESLFVDGRTHFLDKQRATEKISRNVRKMISTFESSQSQELRPLDNVSTERILPMKGPSDEEPTTQKNDQMLSNADMGLKSYTNDGGLRPSRIDRSHELSLGPQSTCPSIENPDTDKLDMRASQNQHAQLSTGNDLYYFESSENWIIPGEKRRLCITTASKRVMNLVRAFDNNEETDQTKRRSSKTFPIKNRYISQEVKKNGKGSHRFRKPKVESSENEKASGGLIGQVVKITIMLAFGTLVLVTRQRSDR